MVDLAGWGPEEWNKIQQAAKSAYSSAALVRGALPIGPAPKDPHVVTIPAVSTVEGELRLDLSKSLRPTRLSCKFFVESEQLEDISLVCQLASKAGEKVGGAESVVLALGTASSAATAANPQKPAPAQMSWDIGEVRVEHGTEGINGTLHAVDTSDAKPTKAGPLLIHEVSRAISVLNGKGHYGPFSLAMHRKMWTTFHGQGSDSDRAVGGILAEVLGEGARVALVQTDVDEAANKPVGHLVSVGSHAVDLVQVDPFMVTIVGPRDGGMGLRAEERFVLRTMDPIAVLRIELTFTS